MERTCTYRVQLHPGFTFDDAAAIVPYLAGLGVTHLYCSPYLQAQAGSTHGYDVVDHSRINVELGGDAGHARLVAALAAHGLGHILDIVPNHMARDGRANRWWWDVLENGPVSRYASYFDIDWEGGENKDEATVLIPVLGDQYGRVLEAGELRVERAGGAFVVRYSEHELPISPRSIDELLSAAAERTGAGQLAELAERFGALPHARRTDPAAVADRHRRKGELVETLAQACAEQSQVAAAIDAELALLNADADALDNLLDRQNYRLAFWRTASEELDYRRFFDVETLVGLRIEDPECFDATHEIPLALAQAGVLDGLRIDHVDGLRDPQGYLDRLRRAGGGVYTVVEKILESGEDLPAGWPVEGTSGYDFLTRVSNLFVDPAGAEAMAACYADFTGRIETYDEVVHHAKQQIMHDELATELERLTRVLAAVCAGHRRHRDHTRRELRAAVRELVAAFGVYRTYVHPDRPVADVDRSRILAAVATARRHR
ncbi:MAG TPA: malto-oligosyltrehalose synthase, partial [Sporichthya sp.]|nr:malto-oligosyltrehalose synthase [Sporichthya sp.]